MTIGIRTASGGRTEISPSALAALRSGIRGALIGPGDAGYDEARRVWNGMIDRRPGLIARCAGAADVVRVFRFAREHGLLFSVRGGGHNIAGLAVCEEGLVIDLSPMKGVWVDPKTRRAHAQAGCTLGEVDRETQLHGLAAVLGFVSTTGIAGLTVGGGFGYLTRRHGWTCDNVASTDVVTPAGELVRADEADSPELFWALRGGGGNFGIVTSFEYRLHPVGPEILGGAIAWRGEDAKEVLGFYREFTAKAPRELTCVAVLRIAPPAPWLPAEIHGKPIVAVFVCHSGGVEDGERLLAPLRALGRPVADVVRRLPYAGMQTLLDATQPPGRRYYWKSHYLPGLSPRVIDVTVERARALPSPHSAIVFFHLEGALGELSAGHSPVGNRDAAFVLNVTGAWERPENDAENIAWTREVFEATREDSTGGTYLNFLTEEETGERIRAAYGPENLRRLSELKRKLDPEDLFRHAKPLAA